MPHQRPSVERPGSGSGLDPIAEQYVRLVLALSLHDPDHLDAYYGPPRWRRETEAEAPSPAVIRNRTTELRKSLPDPDSSWDPSDRLRHRFLEAHLGALESRIRMVQGERLSFDQESEALYGTVAPRVDEQELRDVLDRIARRLAAEGFTGGSLAERLESYWEEFVVPRERVDEVLRTALDTAREVTAEHLPLPIGERVRVEYVEDAPWSAYNWYQGRYESLIQVSVDIPLRVYEVWDLACHEGYPGHHAHHSLMERHLFRERGWVEHGVYGLFSPQALTSEGVATLALHLAFGEGHRLEFLRDELFPRAGLDPRRAEVYLEILELRQALAPGGAEAARRYHEGDMDADATAHWLIRHLAVDSDRAARAVRFYRRYGAYVVTYSRGREILRAHLQRSGGERDRETRWRRFRELVTTPRLLADLEPREKLPPRSPLDPRGALSG